MRFIAWWIALGIAIAVAPASAQEQKTLGPCSPAVTGVNGNVTVTCLTNDQRIRIARFIGSGTKVFPGLTGFMSSNAGQFIYLDVHIDLTTSGPSYDKELRALTFSKYVDFCKDDPFGLNNFLCNDKWEDLLPPTKYIQETHIYFKNLESIDDDVYMRDQTLFFRGYYRVEDRDCMKKIFLVDVSKKICEVYLYAIQDEKITMSDKYDTR